MRGTYFAGGATKTPWAPVFSMAHATSPDALGSPGDAPALLHTTPRALHIVLPYEFACYGLAPVQRCANSRTTGRGRDGAPPVSMPT